MKAEDDTAQLRQLIRKHRGCVKDVAEELSRLEGARVSRQAVWERIVVRGLDEEVRAARRPLSPEEERARVQRALESAPNRKVAARRLGWSRRKLFRKLVEYAEQDEARAALGI